MSASIIQPLYLSCRASVFLEHCPQVAVEQTCCITLTPATSVLSFCITLTPATSVLSLTVNCLLLLLGWRLTVSPSVAQTMQLLRAPSHFRPSYVDQCFAVLSSVTHIVFTLCTHSWCKCTKPLRAIVCRPLLCSAI